MDGRRPTYDELQARVAALEARNGVLAGQVARLTAQVESLLKRLEEKGRTGKRQAAPFSKGPPQPDPQPPGRKPGDDYGRHHRRAIPEQPPDEVYDVPLPAHCPDCASTRLVDDGRQSQWQTDLPTRPIVRRFDIHCGHCADCGGRVQGRHPLQTSDALGAAASQLGPHVHAAKAILNKGKRSVYPCISRRRARREAVEEARAACSRRRNSWTESGWAAAQASGSRSSRTTPPAARRSSTSRRYAHTSR